MSAPDDGPRLRLTWARTWPDEPLARHDFIGCIGGRQVARIYLSSGSGQKRWEWTCADTHQIAAGWKLDKMAAARDAEDAYFAAVEGRKA